jgi:hypothetical protein
VEATFEGDAARQGSVAETEMQHGRRVEDNDEEWRGRCGGSSQYRGVGVMLKAWASSLSPRVGLLAVLVSIASGSAAVAAPVVPWVLGSGTNSSGQTYGVFASATAAVGIEPNTSAALSDWGPAVTFVLPNNSSFTNVAYTPGAGPGETPPYVSNGTTFNIGGDFPGSSSLQPNNPANLNISEVGPFVASSVTAIAGSSGTIYTDPYPYGNPIAVSGTSNLNLNGFNPGSNAAIIAGNVSGTNLSGGSAVISLQWRTRSQNEMDKGTSTFNDLPPNAKYVASEVVQLSGIQSGASGGSDYVFQMDFANEVEVPNDQMNDILADRDLFLGELINSGGTRASWVNAVSRNTASSDGLPAVGAYAWQPNDGTSLLNQWVPGTSPSQQPFIGSFQDFLDSTYIQNGVRHYFYEHPLDQLRGTWGIDTSTDTAWAVLDNDGTNGVGIFAVVPEPASIRLLAAGVVCLVVGFWWRWRTALRTAAVG